MADPKHSAEPGSRAEKIQSATGEDKPKLKPPAASQPDASTSADPASSTKLTADEQMALYENDLKENDWGHQPC